MDEPFVLHNVDVISTIDLARMVQIHKENKALATLAVMQRKSSRQLLFDATQELCGRIKGSGQPDEIVRQAPTLQPLAFAGVHVISPRLLGMIERDGIFSIIDAYLDVAARGGNIQAFRADEFYWRDLGKLDQVAQAELDYRQKMFA